VRVAQPVGERGSLKWIQRAVAERWDDLEAPVLACLSGAHSLEWLSPLPEDEFAEYRDAAFLRKLGLERLAASLADFWPRRGPQWDALATSDAGHILLVEAKAHIGEFVSPPSQASPESLNQIRRALTETAGALSVAEENKDGWSRHFYQYANRLAHLNWMRGHGADAKLVLVGFVHDDDMPGRTTREAWQAAYLIANSVLGLRAQHPLAAHIIHVHPEVDRH